ncbi:MAG: MarR family transcriptional regulator [Thermomicrobiales bacterium]
MMSSIESENCQQLGVPVERADRSGVSEWQQRQVELEYRLLLLVDRLRTQISGSASQLGLTPQQATLLRHLGTTRTVSELANLLACDRSNVTGLIKRLTTRGLVEQTSDTRDKRVRHLRLTEAGEELRVMLQRSFFAESPATRTLRSDERSQFLALLRKVTSDDQQPDRKQSERVGNQTPR